MSFNEKNIDQLFRSAAQSQSATEFKPEYWEEMNQFLNARDKRKRKGVLWFTTISALLIGVGIILFIFPKQDGNDHSNEFIVNDNIPTDSEQLKTAEEVNDKVNNIAAIDNQLIEDESINSSQTIQIKNSKNNINQEFNTVKTPINPIHQNQNTSDYTNIQAVNPLAELEENKLEESIQNDYSGKEMEIQENQLDSYSLSPMSSTILTVNNEQNIIPSKIKYTPLPRFNFYGKIVGGLMENYKTRNPFESGILDLSLNVELTLQNKLLIRSGLGSQFTSNADLILTRRYKESLLDASNVTEIQTDLAYQNFIDLYIPLEFGFQLGKNAFGVGIQGNYLVGTSMVYSMYEDNVLTNTEKLKGNKDGLADFSMQGYVWYEHYFTQRMALGIKVGTHVTSRIKDNSIFSSQASTTNPIYGQLSLRFNVIK